MKYTVVVKEIVSSNGDYKRCRYNKVPGRIVNWLMAKKFSFSIGIANNYVNQPSANNYIEVYLKCDHMAFSDNWCENGELNKQLKYKLEKLSK